MASKGTTYEPRRQPAAMTKQELRACGKIDPAKRLELISKMCKKTEAAARKAEAASSISSRQSTPAPSPPSSPASSIVAFDAADQTKEVWDNVRKRLSSGSDKLSNRATSRWTEWWK
ncbi:hypothetical protein LTS10_008813 [Elasticomyces elasticus]|nr:hypothetical protein LTS10_008813 [Elasticomyces elasticus]